MIQVVNTFFIKEDKIDAFTASVEDIKKKIQSLMPKDSSFVGIWRHGFGQYWMIENRIEVKTLDLIEKIAENPAIVSILAPFINANMPQTNYSLRQLA